MSTDYESLTKPLLEAQLKERGLPHSGKKADLVARLQEDDVKKATTAPAASEPAQAKEDEIDWEEEEPKATEAPARAQSNEPQPAAAEASAAAPITETTMADAANATSEPSAEAAPAKNFSLGLADVTVSEELEKMKARAKKFGTTEDETVKENIAKLERLLKYGAEEQLPSGLNGALPEKQRRERRPDHRNDNRVHKRGHGDRNRNGRGRDRRDGGGQRREQRNGASGNGAGWMSQKDREQAEARKKRFAGES